MKQITTLAIAVLCMFISVNHAHGQAEVSGWGNLRGIRYGDQLVAFTTAVGVFNPDFTRLTLSQREGPIRTTLYRRYGNTVTVGENLQYGGGGAGGRGTTNPATNPGRRGGGGRGAPVGGFDYTMSYTDTEPGTCQVKLELASPAAQSIAGIFYFITLPAAEFTDGSASPLGGQNSAATPLNAPNQQGRYLSANCSGIRISGRNNSTVEVNFPQPLDIVVQRGRGNGDIQVYFPILVGSTTAGQTASATFTLKASTDIDTSPVALSIDPSKTGRPWLGVGGNFRIQNERLDALHIRYIMDNMRIAYGRVAMPWNVWQPEENSAPPLINAGQTSAAASGGRGGGMNAILPAMEIAQTLAKQKIPMIISCWSPPNWAVLPNDPSRGGRGGGLRGQRLDPAKWDQICKSIGSYLIYLRDQYGAEPELFSFNESDAGINVRQSPEDHAEAIRKLGEHFKSIGLKTRMLLGDTGDVPPANFIEAAMNDPQAQPYIGAVSFHSWRGATDAQYQKWADAAAKLGVPLFDAEGGNDAQAYSYPSLFREEWYAMDEASEYVRIMRICQPKSILQWQLTENYSVLSADADGTLRPTQRFFNLKQFNLTPPGSNWIEVNSSNPLVLAAAFADPSNGVYSIHLVNNGAARQLNLTGLPASVNALTVHVTDQSRGMAEAGEVKVSDGAAKLTLPARALVTLISASR